MNTELTAQQVHLWQSNLIISDSEEEKLFNLLSVDEGIRANRFHFAIHKRRFIAARAMLRKLLAMYLSCHPKDIIFGYTEHHKPFLEAPQNKLHFNVSHSHDIAVYAFTLHHDVGIDIEMIRETYNPALAIRYFAETENTYLQQSANQTADFYRIWARKEAFIKAIGRGLSIPLSSFSVIVHERHDEQTKTTITYNGISWQILDLSIHSAFKAALVCDIDVREIVYCQMVNDIPNVSHIVFTV